MNIQDQSYERYQRQIILPELGEAGQEKLSRARVLIVGAGGLGCPALQYLVAAGVGTIGIVDDDTVSIQNLHRQVLYTTNDIGLLKTEICLKRLKEMNPVVQIRAHSFRLTNQNALSTISEYEIVIDATDNFASRYMINDACVLLGKPLVYGAISQFEGQVAVFNVTRNSQSVNYRDLFPEPPTPGSVLNCAEAGVLGVITGIIGTMQANEAIKLITGMGEPLVNRLLTYNALSNESRIFNLLSRKETSKIIPIDFKSFEKMNYEWWCNSSNEPVEEIDSLAFERLMDKEELTIIDVREEGESPEVTEFPHLKFPLSKLKNAAISIEGNNIVLFCQSGTRSKEAAKILSANFGSSKKIYSLKGGINQWKKHEEA